MQIKIVRMYCQKALSFYLKSIYWKQVQGKSTSNFPLSYAVTHQFIKQKQVILLQI